MDQKIREMQERLDKVGTARPFVPPVQNIDFSAMQSRLDKVSTSYKPFVAPAAVVDRSEMEARLSTRYSRPDYTPPVAKTVWIPELKVIGEQLPVAKSIPPSSKENQPKPEALPTQPIKSSLSSVPLVPIEKPYQPIENELTSTYSTAPDAPPSADYSPRITPRSKRRSSWILWLWMFLLVAFVIGQLIWVMS
ncbi:hypothetical protein L0663_05135 [Dyadobacter sp. CY107]|uniref:hypothetical protein n=1 Tax=Dyadobacter fanqingshengii TaxID=2906443 RepID=UPI001F18978A|nr:hypothetical protein [Dyadobacter fanqingshengii]MCF2502751.1 hypothetical protein [Dyadobacter fanqingshengii]